MELFDTLVLLGLLLIFYFYWRVKKTFSYFEQHGIPHLKPTFPFGNMADVILLRKTYLVAYRDLYDKLEPHDFAGVFIAMKKVIMIRDPELVKNVLIRDFHNFYDRDVEMNTLADPLKNHLFGMKGEEWKNLRAKLTTSFTPEKMKFNFPLINKCGEKLNNLINQIHSQESFEIKELIDQYAVDSAVASLFGIEGDSLGNRYSQFTRALEEIYKFKYLSVITTLWPNIIPAFMKNLYVSLFGAKSVNFLVDLVDKIVKIREENNTSANNLLDVLIALKNNTIIQQLESKGETLELEEFLTRIGDKQIKSDIHMTNDILTAQCLLFLMNGAHPTANTMGFLMLELAKNQDIQLKLRHEIKSVLEKNHGQLTYDIIDEMTYLDMAIDETQRMYAAGMAIRKAIKDYKIPGHEVIIPTGTTVVVPGYAIHHDPKYYDDPDQFRPDRFSKSEKSKRPSNTYIPFGDGPRGCIAKRLGKLQIKIGLVHMLKDFSYRPSPRMKFPITFENIFKTLKVEGGIWLQRERV